MRLALWGALSAWALFVLSWGALHWLIVPRLEQWRPALESVASQALGVRVQVAEWRATDAGAIPAFELRGVRLFDRLGREALHLPRVRGVLSVRSLWRGGFEQLVVEAPVLSARRTRDGQIEMGGIAVGLAGDDEGRLADWVLSQTELAIRDGTLRWVDETRPDAPALVLSDIQAVVRRHGRQHEGRFDATPQGPWGERFSLRADLREPFWASRPGDWRAWAGTLYADLPWVDLRQLQQHMALPGGWGLGVDQGRGAVRAWVDLQRGQLAGLQADLALPEVALRWAGHAEPFALRDLSVRLQAQQHEGRARMSTQQLAFTTADGLVWPGGDVAYEQVTRPDGDLREWSVQADHVALAPLQRLGRRLPLPPAWRQVLADTRPEGRAQALSLHWQAAEGGQPPRWSATGRLEGLQLAAAEAPPAAGEGDPGATPARAPDLGRPGVRGLDLSFDLNQAGGHAEWHLRDGALVFPGVFEEPELAFDRLDAEVRWTQTGERLDVDVRSLHFANADAEGGGRLRWHTAENVPGAAHGPYPGVLDLDVRLSRADGARVHRYLPQAMPSSVRHYLRDAVRQGQARDVRFLVQGDLADFPYADPARGRFEVRAQLQDVAFDYVPAQGGPPDTPAWPALEAVQAQLLIDRVRLQLGAAKGRVRSAGALQALQVEARIGDYTTHDPHLTVRGQVRGPGEEALAFVQNSPLGGLLSGALDQARLTGAVDLGLELDLPLERLHEVKVRGQLRLSGNDLRLSPDAPWLQATTGRLDFSERGFRAPQVTAHLFGGELRFSGGLERQGDRAVLRFQGQGGLTAEGLRRAVEAGPRWAALSGVGARATGSTTYRARLEVVPEGTNLRIDSDLQGLALDLPAPLSKPAAALWPLRLEQAVLDGAGAATEGHPGAQRDRLAFDLGAGSDPLLSARYEREHGPDGVRVLRGALSVGRPAQALPATGVHARLALGELDLQAWQRWWEAWPVAAVPSTAPPERPGADEPTAALAATQPYWPTEFALSADRIGHDGRSFHEVVAGGSRLGDDWRLSVSARELNGYVEYRPSAAAVPGRVYARLARLSLPPATATGVEQLLQTQPQAVPALDVVVDELELKGRRLGRLEVVAENRRASTVAREGGREAPAEWRLTTLNLTVPEARLQASGNWAALGGTGPREPGRRRTALNVQLSVQDAGALLERFGMPGVVRGGQGKLQGTLGWVGSPLSMDLPSLSGELGIDLQRGQFLQADPGLAKLLGVLNLQSLPRRLALDFRDVFSAGFAFDFVRGNARIAQGVASTNNLQMKGVSAAVLLEGSADTVRETQDLSVVVVPELNAGTAALLATAISPVTGLGTFLAQFLLRQPLQEAATQQFRVTGPWADPHVEKVNRRNMAAEGGASARPGATP